MDPNATMSGPLWEEAKRLFYDDVGDAKGERMKDSTTLKETVESLTIARNKVAREYGDHSLRLGKDKKPLVTIKLGRIMKRLEVLMKIGDAYMECAPETVSLVWMSFRMIFTGFLKDSASCEFFTDAVDQITDIMFICNVFEKRYLKTNGVVEIAKAIKDRVLAQIPPLYAAVLKFSYQSRKLFAHGKLVRSVMSWRSEELQDTLNDAQRKRNTLQDTANVGFQEATLDALQGLEGIQVDTSIIRDAAEVIQNEVAPGVKKIQAEQERVKDKQAQEDIEKRYNEQLEWLKTGPISELAWPAQLHDKNLKKIHPGTTDWLIKEQYFDWWQDPEYSKGGAFLWLWGQGGFGKSFLMSSMIDHVSNRSQPEKVEVGEEDQEGEDGEEVDHSHVVYFFCKKGDEATSLSNRIFLHLLIQLYEKAAHGKLDSKIETQEKFAQKVHDVYEDCKAEAKHDASLLGLKSTMVSLFQTLVKELGKKVYVFIDALDECADYEEFLSALWDLPFGSHIHLLVSSRPDVFRRLRDPPAWSIEVNAVQTHKEIEKYVLSKVIKLKRVEPKWRKRARDLISQRSEGSFRYADVVLEALLQQAKTARFNTLLESLPNGMHALYRNSVASLDLHSRKMLIVALRWLMCSSGQVTLELIADELEGKWEPIQDLETRHGDDSDEDDEDLAEFMSDNDDDDDDASIEYRGSFDGNDLNIPNRRYRELREETPFIGPDDLLGDIAKELELAGRDFLTVDPNAKFIEIQHNSVRDFVLSEEEEIKPDDVSCLECRKRLRETYVYEAGPKEGNLIICRLILQRLNNRAFQKQHIIDLASPPEPERVVFRDPQTVSRPASSENKVKYVSESPVGRAKSRPESAGSEVKSKPGSSASQSRSRSKSREGRNTSRSKSPGSKATSHSRGRSITVVRRRGKRAETLSQSRSRSPASVVQEEDAAKSQSAGDSKESAKDQGNHGHELGQDEIDDPSKDAPTQPPVDAEIPDVAPDQAIPSVEEIQESVQEKDDAVSGAADNTGDGSKAASEKEDGESNTSSKSATEASAPQSSLAYSFQDRVPVARQRYEVQFWMNHIRRLEDTITDWEEVITGKYKELYDGLENFLQSDSDAYQQWLRLKLPRRVFKTWDSPLHVAGRFGILGLLRRWRDGSKYDVHEKNENGNTPLHLACTGDGDFKGVEFLCDMGADIECLNDSGETPLFVLICNGSPMNLVEYMLKKGAKPNIAASSDGVTCLHFAVENGDVEMVRKLLGYDEVDVNQKDFRGETPLHWAFDMNRYQKEIVDMLIEKGADVNAQDDDSQGPLYEACDAGNAEAAKILLQHGADIDDDENVFGRTALHAAIFARSPETVKLLIEKGANLQLKSKQGQDALYQSIVVGDLDPFNDILDKLAKTEKLQDALLLQESLDNRTALHCAAAYTDKEMIELLLQKAPDVSAIINTQDRQGDTALHIIADTMVENTVAIVKELLKHNADCQSKNSKNQTPIDIVVDRYVSYISGGVLVSGVTKQTLELLLEKAPDAVQDPKSLVLADILMGDNSPICEVLKGHREEKEEHGWTLLELARHLKRDEKIELLLKDVKEDSSAKLPGLRPTGLLRKPLGLHRTISDMIKVSDNRLELSTEPDESVTNLLPVAQNIYDLPVKTLRYTVMSDHPTPPSMPIYYYEFEILALPENSTIFFGFANSGGASGRFNAQSWAFSNDEGTIMSDMVDTWDSMHRSLKPMEESLEKGDIIGCGFSWEQEKIFFTKNGKRLPQVFNQATGILYPYMSIFSYGVRVRFNFGHDVAHPFKCDTNVWKDPLPEEERRIVKRDTFSDEVPVYRRRRPLPRRGGRRYYSPSPQGRYNSPPPAYSPAPGASQFLLSTRRDTNL